MMNRYLTHFSTVLLLHMIALAVGLKLLDSPKTSTLPIGPSVLKLQLASSILMAPKVVPVAPKQYRVIPGPHPRQEEAVSASPVANPLSGTQTATVREMFKAELRSEIEKNKYYPPMSRRLGQTGTVVVAFTLLEDGHIIDVKVERPSNFERLNKSALEAVKKVHKFKPIPKELALDKMDLSVPITFLTI